MTKLTCPISRKAKLGLTAQGADSTVFLFPEGLFVRAYNQSAYILTALLGYDLKVTFSLPSKNTGLLVFCGVRSDRIKKHFKDAKLNKYGYYTLNGKFDLSNYQNWVNDGVQSLINQQIEKGTGNAVFEDFDENTNWQSPDDLEEIIIQLTEAQIEFLINWDPETSTAEENDAFIEELRQAVIAYYEQKMPD